MSKPESITVYRTDWLTLFDYEQNDCRTSIKILSEQTNIKREINRRDFKGHTMARLVRFKLCGLDLSDSFEALSIVLALVKVFEHRQYGTGDKGMTMTFPTPNDPELRLFCNVQPYKDAYEGIRFGWSSVRNGRHHMKEHIMHIGYVHHLRNALHRATGWISPETRIQYAELPDIKEEIRKQPGNSSRYAGFP